MLLRRAAALLLLLAAQSFGADQEGIAFFEQKVRPVLVEHCYECHSADAKKLKGNLYLDSKAGWEAGGDSGESIIVPGKPEESLLVRAIRHAEPDLEMPPKKERLDDTLIADLITWIRMGAPDPRTGAKVEVKRADKSWWSLQPMTAQFRHTSVDGFIREKLEENGLKLSAPAAPRTLIRRMTYDLTGLPPTPEDVLSFERACADGNREAATAALIDRLLASPRYGERWGRHWLDVIRFGESNGFERNFIINDLWPFRDYVIRSLNDDKPFDQFIVEHLAGDVIGKDQPEIEIGSAFLVAGPYDDVGNQDVVAQKNIRAATLDDIITATSGAFLGLTINCARCHDHKFDPIPTEDYYRLRAAFEGVTHGRRVVASNRERAEFASAVKTLEDERSKLQAQRAKVHAVVEARAAAALEHRKSARPKIDPDQTDETFQPVEARYVRFVIHALTTDYQARTDKGPRARAPGSGRLTEFEVWTAGDNSRNVALAANGARAEGAKSATAADFPEAYGAHLTIDGRFGEQWFIGTPAELKITLAQSETISRISFRNSKEKEAADKARGGTPCEYEIQVSSDGQRWQTVASSDGREPWSEAHAIEQIRREVITPEEKANLAALDRQLGEIKAKLGAVPKLREIWAGKFSQPAEQTFVFKGGDPTKPLQTVLPSSLSVLANTTTPFELKPDAPEGGRRLALAKWIANPENPLTARVIANRLWQHHFGTGIVDTPSDFGFLGSKPTHPELLDFLAQRLIANGWRLKALHREILLSATYQQASAHDEKAAQADKSARLLWRFPPRRLSGEEIRDTMLAVSGKLRLDPMGGPGFRLYKVTENNVSTYVPLEVHGPESYRRSVYHQNARASVVDVLSDFDLPDSALAAPRRANTTTPLQALTMLNHSFTFDMARFFSERLGGTDPVTQAYSIAYQREPNGTEREAASKLLAEHGAAALCRAILNSNEFIHVE
jgi:mono/diheme cytochrome c family protein